MWCCVVCLYWYIKDIFPNQDVYMFPLLHCVDKPDLGTFILLATFGYYKWYNMLSTAVHTNVCVIIYFGHIYRMMYRLQNAATSIHFCDPKKQRQWQLQAWTLGSNRLELEFGSVFRWHVTTARTSVSSSVNLG